MTMELAKRVVWVTQSYFGSSLCFVQCPAWTNRWVVIDRHNPQSEGVAAGSTLQFGEQGGWRLAFWRTLIASKWYSLQDQVRDYAIKHLVSQYKEDLLSGLTPRPNPPTPQKEAHLQFLCLSNLNGRETLPCSFAATAIQAVPLRIPHP